MIRASFSKFNKLRFSFGFFRSSCTSQFNFPFQKHAFTTNDLHGNKSNLSVSFEDISRAQYRIQGGLKLTECSISQFLSEICECEIWLKRDFLQFTGSFKERGARNSLMLLSSEEKERGIIAASAGNHALALAWHGKELGVPVTCVMPILAPLAKVDKCRKFGANVIIHGSHIGESRDFAQKEHPEMKYINGYDDPEIIAGAGTMGIEIIQQARDIDVILVPVGGGGLVAGVSLAVKTLHPHTQVIGVEPENAASFSAALKAGSPEKFFINGTIADGLAVPVVGTNAFEIAKHFVASSWQVSEKMIAIAVLRLIEMEKIVVEGAGATALAAVLPGGPLFQKFKGQKVCVCLCGGNIDTTVLGRVIERGLAADMRLIRFSAVVSDRPGGIAAFTKILADVGVCVKDIYHERAWLHSRVDLVVVKCVVETTGPDHVQQLFMHLETNGFPIIKD